MYTIICWVGNDDTVSPILNYNGNTLVLFESLQEADELANKLENGEHNDKIYNTAVRPQPHDKLKCRVISIEAVKE